LIKQEKKILGVNVIGGLRELGYTPEISIADIVDNSITHNAKNIEVRLWEGGNKYQDYVSISDDGDGMNEDEIINKAMEWGKNQNEVTDDIRDFSKYGLGLKLASIAHCRKLTVLSKGSKNEIHFRTLDLDEIHEKNELIISNKNNEELKFHIDRLEKKDSGTTIIWQNIEKLYESEVINKRYTHRVMVPIRDKIKKHLGMVFSNFLNEVQINMPFGKRNYNPKCEPWDPFVEKYSQKKPTEPINFEGNTIKTTFYILPKRTDFEDETEYENAAGPTGRWLDRQGIYIYRKGRLILPGGWHGLSYQGKKLEPKDNFQNRVRIKIDYDGKNDSKWKLRLSKSEAIIPGPIKSKLEQLLRNIFDEVKNSEKKVIKIKDTHGYDTPWEIIEKDNNSKIKINRKHKLIEKIKNDLSDKSDLSLLLNQLEQTIPNINTNKTIDNETGYMMEPKIMTEFKKLLNLYDEETVKNKLKDMYPNHTEFVESLNKI